MHVDEGKAISLPPRSSGPNAEVTHYRKLAERKGKRLQCRRSLCQEAFFLFCLFQVALGKAPGVYTQRSVYARWQLKDTWRSRGSAFLNSKRLCPLFFSSTLSDERCSNLSFESPNQNPKNRTLNSHRDTGGTRCVLWEVTMYGHLPLTKLGFLPVPLWPIFLLKCSLRPAMLQLEFRWSKPDEKHPKQSKTETRKTAFRLSKTLKSYAGDGPAAAGCPVSNPDNNCANGLLRSVHTSKSRQLVSVNLGMQVSLRCELDCGWSRPVTVVNMQGGTDPT